MFTHDEYQAAWIYYALGVACCGYCWWVITAKIKWLEVRVLLRALLFTLLITPWFSHGTTGFLSPAIIVMFIEGLFVSGGTFARAGTPLLVVNILCAVVVLIFFAVRHFWLRRKGARRTQAAADA